ncbi:FecR family protein [Pedobacter nutrimenti]|uniref:FecR family protein n=1 Tax=Pedobacter nutrimenti TaxID=1241337 RepID=UPI0029319DB8|nr:FecR family protein [Pedobacter nutrimenti]
MDYNQYTSVDFLTDESFLSYCAGNDEEHVRFWQNYTIEHPEKEQELSEAMVMYQQLSGNKRPVETELANFKQLIQTRLNVLEQPVPELSESYVSGNGQFKMYKMAALVMLVVLISGFFVWKKSNLSNSLNAEQGTQLSKNIFQTEKAQRKKITFEDGTTVSLNADTKISLRKGYNKNTREVDLIGEAFFEVEHNPAVPFIVHTAKLDVKVLGTKFNVSAYPDERRTEASLIMGSIQASLNDKSHRHFILKPSEKITVEANQMPTAKEVLAKDVPKVLVSNVHLTNRNVVVETAWVNNGLEINNETFIELQQKLEREYGVTLAFKDDEVKKYKFTATLKNEPINEVLKAMQTVNYFNYKIKGNTVQLSK